MKESNVAVVSLRTFYERFSAHDPAGFADIIATGPGVSVIGSGPDEGHDGRDGWVSTYAEFIPQLGLRLEGGESPRGWTEGSVGFVVDRPRFVLPDEDALQPPPAAG